MAQQGIVDPNTEDEQDKRPASQEGLPPGERPSLEQLEHMVSPQEQAEIENNAQSGQAGSGNYVGGSGDFQDVTSTDQNAGSSLDLSGSGNYVGGDRTLQDAGNSHRGAGANNRLEGPRTNRAHPSADRLERFGKGLGRELERDLESEGSSKELSDVILDRLLEERDQDEGEDEEEKKKRKKKGAVGHLRSAWKHVKRIQWLFDYRLIIGFVAVLVIVVLLVLLAGVYKLPDVMQGVESFEFAQTSSQFYKLSTSLTDESLALQAQNDSVFGQLKQRYGNMRDAVWTKVLGDAPDKVIKNMGDNNGLELRFRTSKITGRRIFLGGSINGQDFQLEQVSGIAKYTPVINKLLKFKNRQVFYRTGFLSEVMDQMRANDVGPIVRGVVFLKILYLSGGSLTGWVLSHFTGSNPTKNDEVATKDMFDASQSGAQPDDPSTQQLAEGTDAAQQQAQADSNNPAALDQINKNGGVDPNVLTAADSKLKQGFLANAVEQVGAIWPLASAICTIFDASIQQSQQVIDNQMHEVQNVFDQLAAEADQQKQGNLVAGNDTSLTNAVAATSDEIGDPSTSIPWQRAYGHPQATNFIPSVEADAVGGYTYSVYSALGVPPSSAVGKALTGVTHNVCQTLTNIYTSIGLTIVQFVASIISFGATTEGTEAAGQGARAFIVQYVTTTWAKVFGKQFVKDGIIHTQEGFTARALQFAQKQVILAGGTVGLAFIAHEIVAARSGDANSGFAHYNNLLDMADNGANINANETNRMQLFGRPLLESEVADAEQSSILQVNYENQQKSFTQRYFALDNYDSLLTHISMDLGAANHPTTVLSLAKLGSAILKPLSSVASLFTSLGSSTSYAAGDPNDYDYGNVQFGWSQDEQSLIASSNSYKPLENQKILDQSGNEDKIAQKYSICFGYAYNPAGDGTLDPNDQSGNLAASPSASVGNLLALADIVRDKQGHVINGGGLCDPDHLSYDARTDPLSLDVQDPEVDGGSSPKSHDMIMRWRLAMAYELTADQLISEGVITQ